MSFLLIIGLCSGFLISKYQIENNNIVTERIAGVRYSLEQPIAIAVFDLNDNNQKQLANEVVGAFKKIESNTK